jgi:hypothetical protein
MLLLVKRREQPTTTKKFIVWPRWVYTISAESGLEDQRKGLLFFERVRWDPAPDSEGGHKMAFLIEPNTWYWAWPWAGLGPNDGLG